MTNTEKLQKSQSGQILMFTTIVLMVAALVLVPLMQFVFTSHRSAQIRQERTEELYASDAGIEDALYQIKTETKGTALSNLGFGGDSFNPGTPGVNDRTMDVNVQKIWLPEGDEIPPAMQTEEPVNDDLVPANDTDKSDKLVVVGMLKTMEAMAASDDFLSGFPNSGNGSWTGNWIPSGSASIASSGGCDGRTLKFADADGTASRTANLLKYMKPRLKFTAKALSLEPGDTVNLNVTYGSDTQTVASWTDGNETTSCKAFNIDLYDRYGWYSGDTIVPLSVRFEADLSVGIAAQDNFDTGTPPGYWDGYPAGWSGNWTPSGSASVIATDSPRSLPRQLRLGGAGRVFRGIANISDYSGQQLVMQFYAKRNSWSSSSDDYFRLQYRRNGGSWTTIQTWYRGSVTFNSWPPTPITVNLPNTSDSTSYEIRFYADGIETGEFLYIDDIQITEGDSFYVDNLWIGAEYNSNKIEIGYTDATLGDAYLDRIGVWMPPGCHYVSVVGNQTTVELRQEPTTIRPDTYSSGTILEWDFAAPGVELHEPAGQLPIVKTLTFAYEVDTKQHVEGMFTWIKAHGPSSQTYISWDKGYEIYKAISQAHSEIYGTNTKVTAYVAQGELDKKGAASYGDYVATGSSLLIDLVGGSPYKREQPIDPSDPFSWRTKDLILYDGRSEISIIPSDGKVIAAWLYWSAFRRDQAVADTQVNFMFPKKYSSESFAVQAGNGDDTYTVTSWTASQEPMDFMARTPVLKLTPIRYTSEPLGWATQGLGNDTFFTTDKPVLASPAAKVWVATLLKTEGIDYVIDYATGNVTIINDTLVGQVEIDYSVDGEMTLTGGNYTINQSVLGPDIRYTGFKVINDNLEGTVIIDDGYYAKHWQGNVTHTAYDRFGVILPPLVYDNDGMGWSYLCFRDVTDLVEGTGNGQFAVNGVYATPANDGLSGWPEWCYSAWSIIIVYESPSEPAHQFYLYDPIHNSGTCPFYSGMDQDILFTLSDFYPPDGTAAGKLTYFVGEGDDVYNGDSIGFKGVSDPSYTYLSDGNNPSNDVMNDLCTDSTHGVDIDTFNILQVVGSDTSANVKFHTDTDSWNLGYIVLSFRTLEKPKSNFLFDVASVTYQYELGQ